MTHKDSSLQTNRSMASTDQHDDLKASSPPFQIVLVDIEEATKEKIVCVEKPLEEDKTLAFIALSYRWGEVAEQCIDTRLGYIASVTSFALKDFYALCRLLRRDPDLRSIPYVWIDAICVDQNNPVRRKATIYQMSNLYHRANYILAVPDLHVSYLKNANTANNKAIWNIKSHKESIYHLIHGQYEKLGDLMADWLDEIGVPNDKVTRQHLTTTESKNLFVNRLKGRYLTQKMDNECWDRCERPTTDQQLIARFQDAVNDVHGQLHENINECSLCSLQMNICPHGVKLIDDDDDDDDDDNYENKSSLSVDYWTQQEWLACVLKEVYYDHWKQLIYKKKQELQDATVSLQDMISDWSSRVWVISEYHIAKTKTSRKMKYWFLSLDFQDYDDEGFDKLGFFVFDFDAPSSDNQHHRVPQDPFLLDMFNTFGFFQDAMVRQLNEQSFLKIMLKSKASKNEDRFYAVLPLSEYKNKLVSKDVVTSWQINNMISVKLKLYEWMTTKDKLEMFFCTGAYYDNVASSTFPSFATTDMEWHHSLPPFETTNAHDQESCNFDLNDASTLALMMPSTTTTTENEKYHRLKLTPNLFYTCDYTDATSTTTDFEAIFDKQAMLWKELQIDLHRDKLTVMHIPLQVFQQVPENGELPNDTTYKVLLGNLEKNKWLISPYDFNFFGMYHTVHDNSDKRISLYIY